MYELLGNMSAAPLAGFANSGNPIEIMQSLGAPNLGYIEWLKKYKVENPDDPRHNYDYFKAYSSGVEPVLWDNLSDSEKEEDIEQATNGKRWGEPVTREAAIKRYSGRYMFPDIGKTPSHPIQPK